MRRFPTWVWMVVLVPVLLVTGGWLFLGNLSVEPQLNGRPLSEHLLTLQRSEEKIRASTRKLITDHPSVFGPYCLDLLANGPSTMERWADQIQTKYGGTAVGRKIGLRPSLQKYQARAMAAAALSLLDIPNEEKMAALKPALFDQDRPLRMEASKALAQLGPDSLGILETSLMDRSPGIRNAGIYAMYLMGADAAPALMTLKELLLHEAYNVDPLIYEVFARIGQPSTTVLINALDRASSEGRARILKALAPLGRHLYPHRDMLIAELRHPDSAVRREAASAVMAAGNVDAKTTSLLFPLLKDPEPETRLAVLRLLNARVPYVEPALAILLDLLLDDDSGIREMAGFIIQRMPLETDVSKNILNAALQSEFAYVRENAESRLAHFP